jgi:hypothetical protein
MKHEISSPLIMIIVFMNLLIVQGLKGKLASNLAPMTSGMWSATLDTSIFIINLRHLITNLVAEMFPSAIGDYPLFDLVKLIG